jgi:hypothetical protein
MYACPHCGKPGISVVRKLGLVPLITATCKSCGEEIGVPWWAMLTGLPFLAAVLAGLFFLRLSTALLLCEAGGIVASLLLNIWCVPVVRR